MASRLRHVTMRDATKPAQGGAMTSALRVLAVCEALADHQPVGVRELARALALPVTTVQRALETLRVAGWAIRSEKGAWALSSRCAVIGARAGTAGVLRDLAGPAMLRLQRVSDESVRLWAREGDRVVLIESLDSHQLVRYVSPPAGTTLPLHASASGKAILAFLPEHERDAVLSGPLEKVTDATIVDRAVLEQHLADVRARGYSETYHEARRDVGGVAAPVFDSAGRPIAALSLALPMHRLTDEIVRTYGRHVVTEAEQLTAAFAGSQSEGRARYT